jgi:peptidoglycan/xylan/chitin deacetylase (PgdA/CDA1 family)
MCHGTNGGQRPLDAARFETYFAIAAEMGFESIGYDTLADVLGRRGCVSTRVEMGGREPEHGYSVPAAPEKPILFDFDHPQRSIPAEIAPVMAGFGYTGNWFVNTQPMEELYAAPPAESEREVATWDEIASLAAAGWTIGAHTHTHPDLSALSVQDPTGERVADELDTNNAILAEHLGTAPKDFAFTGTSFSTVAEREVKKRYRLGRLWIVGATCHVDGAEVRYAELAGIGGRDEPDGGPPAAARYITPQSNPYRLPSMELTALLYDLDAYRDYLAGALTD